MHDAENTPEALCREITALRQRVAELETAAAEHTQKEIALQESEARYRLLAENVTDVIWVRDLQFRPIYISPSVTRLRGYSVEEAMSQTLLEALTPASQEVARQAFAHALILEQSGQVSLDRFRTLELEATRKDGSTVWIETSVTFLRDAEGRPVGLLGVNRDISARKQAEEALQQAHDALEARVTERTAALQRAEAESRGFFMHASVGMFACDPTGQFVKVNPAFCAFIGYSEAELLHTMTFWDITHPDFQEMTRQTNAHTVAGTRPTTADEKQYVRKDGTAVWGRVNITWICDDDGKPIQSVGAVEDITEHKQAEEALRVSEEHFRGLVEHSPAAIFLKDQAGHFRLVNNRFEQWYGLAGDDVLGKTSYDLFPPAYAAQYVAQDQAVLATGKMIEQELEVPGADGTLRWMLVTKYPVFDVRGHPIGIGAIHTDLTEHKRAAEQVRFQAQLLDSVRESVVATDLEGHITYWGKGAEALYGYRGEEVIGKPITFIVGSQAEQEEEQQRIRTVAQTGMWQGQYLQQRKEGAPFWADTAIALVTDPNGQPCGFVGIDRDLTAQKQAEEALRESEDRYRRVVEGSLQAILIHQGGILQYVNPACAQMFGYASPDELKGVNLWETLFAPESWEAIQTRIAALLRGETITVHLDFPGVRKDGSRIWIASTGSVIKWHNQLAVASFYTDVTVRKEAEEKRQRLETQLHRSQKMEAIGTLAGGIAHEFNNMLAVILGFTQLATAKVPPTSPVSQYLQAVGTAGRRAKDLVQQLLTFSHPSDYQPEPVPLALVIQEALKLLRATLPTTIEIRQQIAPTIGTVLADAAQLHQVLLTLCANAEYAMRETGGILEVSADNIEVNNAIAAYHPDLQPGSHVRVRVRDTGVGIPADVIGRIFEPFFTTKSIGEGTGMGLAIVHGIVTRHSGVIAVESTPGEGSTFTIYLPQITHNTAYPSDPPEPVMPQGAGCILFVDDEAVLARLGQALLEHLGYDVVVFTSSLAALEAFRAEPYRFDLVITDQTMPAMTGATLVEELRYIRSDIPIILCTGFSHLMNAEKAEALGVDAFVMKPGVTQELAAAIQQVLEKRARREP